MSVALATTALVMGLVGGPHCTAMCGAACAGVVRAGSHKTLAPWIFHGGRLAGYSAAGALVAQLAQGLSWLAGQTAALRPAWTLFHVAVLVWGLMLLTLARQPLWVSNAGRMAWTWLRPAVRAPRGLVVAGAMWSFMPCGLLYSALLVASLTSGPMQGALAMALFAVGSGIWLLAAPLLLNMMRGRANRVREDLGTRLAGLLLAVAAVTALWTDVVRRVAQWCGIV